MSEQNFDLYRDIAKRTDGDVYIGVVGPVRTGKSTLISRMMEELVLSRMAAGPRRERLTDELPQSGSGKTIMQFLRFIVRVPVCANKCHNTSRDSSQSSYYKRHLTAS